MKPPSLLATCLGLGLAGCAMGAPPGFSPPGPSWTMPLVDPLADGRLVTPVYVDGKGPFLFALDPDAMSPPRDVSLAGIADIPAHYGYRLHDESDTTHPTRYAQLPNLKIGTLDISLLHTALVEDHQFDADGRRIWGVLGRDVIADSLVYSFDRDRGIAQLTVQEAFTPASNALAIHTSKLVSRVDDATTRYIIGANIDGAQAVVHLDLGDVPSQLKTSRWADAKLASSEWNMTLVDEVGTHREVTRDATAQSVTVSTAGGVLSRSGIGFVPFEDKRWLYIQFDGTLGLDFLRPYNVAANWHRTTVYLQPRETSPAIAADRLARWGTSMTSRCAAAGCVTVHATAGAPAAASELGMADPRHPTALRATAAVHVDRDPAMAGHDLEVVLAATAPDGKALPPLYVELSARASSADAVIEPRYANATFTVLDLSPFPRACAQGAASCVHLAAPLVP